MTLQHSGGMTMMPWLSFFPWSASGGHDRKSDVMLAFLEMCLIS